MILGHSYVGRLKDRMSHLKKINDKEVSFKFVYQGGLTYSHCLHSATWFEKVAAENPKYVIVILAGNSVGSNKKKTGLIKILYISITNIKKAP